MKLEKITEYENDIVGLYGINPHRLTALRLAKIKQITEPKYSIEKLYEYNDYQNI